MKNTSLRLLGVLMAILLVATACGSSTTTNSAAVDETAEDDSTGEEDPGEEDHGEEHSHDDSAGLEVSQDQPVPAVNIELTESNVAGTFVIDVSLENFTVTPDNVDGDPVDNEGHMHVLVDGVKIERFFELQHDVVVYEGEHLVEVELNANNHAAYTLNGEPIRAGVTVTGTGEAVVAEAPDASEASVERVATYTNGTVELDGDERIEVSQGDVVMLTVSSDVAEQIHVHGVDLFGEVAPGEDAVMVFEVTSAGRFEIEFEGSGQFIAELVVS